LPNMVGKPMEQPVGTPRGRGEPTHWVLGAQGGEVGRRLTAFPRSEQLAPAPVGCADGSICSRYCPPDAIAAAQYITWPAAAALFHPAPPPRSPWPRPQPAVPGFAPPFPTSPCTRPVPKALEPKRATTQARKPRRSSYLVSLCVRGHRHRHQRH
jgi:hypothetical protein